MEITKDNDEIFRRTEKDFSLTHSFSQYLSFSHQFALHSPPKGATMEVLDLMYKYCGDIEHKVHLAQESQCLGQAFIYHQEHHLQNRIIKQNKQ